VEGTYHLVEEASIEQKRKDRRPRKVKALGTRRTFLIGRSRGRRFDTGVNHREGNTLQRIKGGISHSYSKREKRVAYQGNRCGANHSVKKFTAQK